MKDYELRLRGVYDSAGKPGEIRTGGFDQCIANPRGVDPDPRPLLTPKNNGKHHTPAEILGDVLYPTDKSQRLVSRMNTHRLLEYILD